MDGKGWESIPEHLLDTILEKLTSLKDSLQVGVVCQNWHSVFMDTQIQQMEKLEGRQIPMLLIPDDEEPSWSIYNVLDKKFLSTKISMPYKKIHTKGSRGWVVVIYEDMSVVLYKPFSMVTGKTDPIRLPHLYALYQFDDPSIENPDYTNIDFTNIYRLYDVIKVLITSDPLENPDECIVILIMQEYTVAYIRLTQDSTWRICPAGDESTFWAFPADIILYKNLLYNLDHTGYVYSLDLANSNNPILELVTPNVPPPLPRSNHRPRRYIVESNDGELWQVERHMDILGGFESTCRQTCRFRIFRLDFGTTKWVQLTSITNNTIFIGDDSSICVNALNFPGCQPNCIYFSHDSDYEYTFGLNSHTLHCADLGIYHVDTEEFEFHFSIDEDIIWNMSNDRPPMWVMPSLV